MKKARNRDVLFIVSMALRKVIFLALSLSKSQPALYLTQFFSRLEKNRIQQLGKAIWGHGRNTEFRDNQSILALGCFGSRVMNVCF